MLLKGAKFGGGGGRKWRFRQGVITPWEVLALRVTGIVPLPLSESVHSAIHERAVTCWDSVRSPGADDSKSDPTLANPAWARGSLPPGKS
jgi:hypothetical protein